MKRFFALLLVVLMLLPSIISCGKVDEPEQSTQSSNSGTTTSSSTTTSSNNTTTSSNQGGTTNSSTTSSSTGSGNTQGPNVDEPAPEIVTKWSGEVLNILATTWNNAEASAPWSQVELTVGPNDYYAETGFGSTINAAVLNRAEHIKDVYGVELNWVNARTNQIATLISESIVGGSAESRYHIAMPRMLEAQAIVATNGIYNIADRKYIDLDKSYYNQAARESYSVQGITLFAAGDFSFLDEQTSNLIYYNEAMTDGFDSFPDLYTMTKEGKWTLKEMTNVAKLVSKNEGDSKWTDDDTYGFGTTSLSKFFQYSGIQQVSVQDDQYIVSLNDTRVSTLIDELLNITGADWARTSWDGGYDTMQQAFMDGRLLFYNEVVQKTDYFKNQTDEFKVALLPAPKLSESQDTYYTPCSYQSVIMCIPKSTPDREMSDYFFEILSYTGQKYVMSAYKTNLRDKLNAETANQSMEIIEDYIFANLCYDQGYMYGWNGLITHVQNEAYSSGKNNFTASYTLAYEDALKEVENWNLAWMDYNDSIN